MEKWKSRKLIVVILNIVVPVLNSLFGWHIDPVVILGMFGVSSAYLAAQGYIDSKGEWV